MSLPEPFYQDEWATVYCGDNRKIAPLLGEFDLLLTDPPYGIGADNRKRILSRSKLAAAIDYGESDWDKEAPAGWAVSMMAAKADRQIIWGGNYLYGMAPSRCWLVWDKDNTGDFADCELAWTNLEKAVRKFQWRWNGMLQENMANKETRVHPTQKPLALMSWCLSHAPEAKTVLDPWMGSGTTLVAAKARGIKAIGIEINPAYCELAKQRLAQEILQFT